MVLLQLCVWVVCVFAFAILVLFWIDAFACFDLIICLLLFCRFVFVALFVLFGMCFVCLVGCFAFCVCFAIAVLIAVACVFGELLFCDFG